MKKIVAISEWYTFVLDEVVLYRFKVEFPSQNFLAIFPQDMKKIILPEMRFNSCEMRLDIRKLWKTRKTRILSFYEFSNIYFNLTSRGLILISRKLFNVSLKWNSSLLDILCSSPAGFQGNQCQRTACQVRATVAGNDKEDDSSLSEVQSTRREKRSVLTLFPWIHRE